MIDKNNIQTDGTTEKVMSLGSFRKKYEAFGWSVAEIDGHNFEEILGAFEEAQEITTGPQLIIADTVPGKGVSFMENNFAWHSHQISKDEMEKALEELK